MQVKSSKKGAAMDDILLPPEIENIKLYHKGIYHRVKTNPLSKSKTEMSKTVTLF